MNIGSFRKYREKNFGSQNWSEIIRDKRKRPQIPTVQIFESLYQMPVLGQKSLLELDEFSRTKEALKWHGSQREMVVSDTTLERVVEGFDLQSVAAIGYQITDQADEQALWDLKLPSGRKLRMGILDGHYAGGAWVSVLAAHGKITGVVDLKQYAGRGHELAASRCVLKRAFKKRGKGFFGIVAGDGLYATRKDFQLCLDQKSHLLVKTDEEDLTAIQDARYLFDSGHGSKICGWDAERKIEYEVMLIEGVDWQGLKMTVARVKEHHITPKKDRPDHTEFWVMTTAVGYSGEDLRELAHLRWKIENNIFKRLNYLVGSKRCWTHKPKVMAMLLRIWMMGLTLLGAYLTELGWEIDQPSWKTVKRTWATAVRQMRASLVLFSS